MGVVRISSPCAPNTAGLQTELLKTVRQYPAESGAHVLCRDDVRQYGKPIRIALPAIGHRL